MLIAVVAGPLAAEEPSDAQTFTDWRVSCPDQQPCRMSQTVVQPATARSILQIKAFAGETPTLLVTMPLGVLLSPGWRFQIDSQTPNATPFEICDTDGCHTGLKLNDTFLRRLQRGGTLKITFYDAAQEPVEPQISLMGFTKAWEDLQSRSAKE